MWKSFSDITLSNACRPEGKVTPLGQTTITPASLQERLDRAKQAYSTRRVDLGRATCFLDQAIPASGDVVLARVVDIGQHTRLELRSGRRATLHTGDEIVVCYGARYAPDQFEAYVPDDTSSCHLVAAGGIAAVSVNRHRRMKRPTRIEPVGILADDADRRLNLADYGMADIIPDTNTAPVIAVLGTSMNSGKTTTASAMVLGLRRQGKRVAAAKITGTGAGGDRWMLLDAGATQFMDFTDAGVPSTFGLPAVEIERIFLTLIGALQQQPVDALVIEIADGLIQRETACLVDSDAFRSHVDGILFAAGDALGAAAGVQRLTGAGHHVLGVSGVVTSSPLAVRETEQLTDSPVVTIAELSDGSGVPVLPGACRPGRKRSAA